MKVSAIALILLLSVSAGQTTTHEWTGKISDSQCREHHEQTEGVDKMSDADCTAACIRGGSKYVFVTDEEKVYLISNQDQPNLPKLAGVLVKVTGELKGEAIVVSKVEKVPDPNF